MQTYIKRSNPIICSPKPSDTTAFGARAVNNPINSGDPPVGEPSAPVEHEQQATYQ